MRYTELKKQHITFYALKKFAETEKFCFFPSVII